jgi:hypothetical protein
VEVIDNCRPYLTQCNSCSAVGKQEIRRGADMAVTPWATREAFLFWTVTNTRNWHPSLTPRAGSTELSQIAGSGCRFRDFKVPCRLGQHLFGWRKTRFFVSATRAACVIVPAEQEIKEAQLAGGGWVKREMQQRVQQRRGCRDTTGEL